MNTTADDKNNSAQSQGKTPSQQRDSSTEFECIRLEKVSHDQPINWLDEEDDSFSKGYN